MNCSTKIIDTHLLEIHCGYFAEYVFSQKLMFDGAVAANLSHAKLQFQLPEIA